MIRRICGNRRVVLAVQLAEDFVIADDAVADDMNIKAYQDSLFDESHIKIKPGCEPVYFTLAPLNRMQKLSIESLGVAQEKAYAAIKCSLKSIENYYIQDDSGTKKQPDLVFDSRGELTDKTLDALYLPDKYVIGLFSMIRTLTEPPLPL